MHQVPMLALVLALAAPAAAAPSAAVVDPAPEAETPGSAYRLAAEPETGDGSRSDAPEAETRAVHRLDADQCAAMAVQASGLVREADAKVSEWKGRLAEVESIFYPKLSGMGYIAPMFRVRGSPTAADVDRDYGQWGPYLHLEAMLAQPLYTFGRAAAGEDAAKDRIAVEQARARQVRNTVALEARKMYFMHLYARSMLPSLENGRRLLDGALEQARTEYASGSGKVSRVDVSKLEYASTELDKNLVQARIGADLALAALKHTMGLPQEAQLELADSRLPRAPDLPLQPLAELLQLAATERPEWAQIKHGTQAALSLEQAERLANAPVVFAAATFGADYTAMRPDAKNPYAYDPYNQISGGVAVGLLFDIDPAKASAKARQARAIGDQVDALATFASTGIPLEVRKARDDAQQAEEFLALANEGARAARKWMIFAGAAFSTGTGDASDVLEGLAAYLQAKNGEYESLRDVHTARAHILYATGRTQPAS